MKKDKFLVKNEPEKVETVIDWTPEQVEELRKCIHDPIYFAENYFVIRTLDDGDVKIKLYDWQKEFIQQYLANRHNISCVARQLGKTTLTVILALWRVLFESDSAVAIASAKWDQAKHVMEMIKRALDNMPDFLKPNIKDKYKETISFKNGSSLLSVAIDPVPFCSRSVRHLFLDEYAFTNDEISREFFHCMIPVVSSSRKSKITIISSASKTTHKFYHLLTAAQNKENSHWAASTYNWTALPSRNEKWKTNMQNILSNQTIWEKEYENVFSH